MSKTKKIILLTIFNILLFAYMSNSAFAIDIYYDNKLVQTDIKPFFEDDVLFVPIGDIIRTAGLDYSWDNATKSIYFMIPMEAEIKLTAGKDEFEYKSLGLPLCAGGDGCQGEFEPISKKLPKPIKLINNKLFVPFDILYDTSNIIILDKQNNAILIDTKSIETKYNKEILDNIINALKQTPKFKNDIKKLENIKIRFAERLSPAYELAPIFNEVLPGPYNVYYLDIDNKSFPCYVNIKTKKVYLQEYSNIFALPEYKFVFSEEFIGPISVLVDDTPKPNFLNQSSIDFSSFINYPKKDINDKNAVDETVKILKKLNLLDQNKKYNFKVETYDEKTPYSIIPSYTSRYISDGYIVSISVSDKKGEVADIPTKYYINKTGTLVIQIYNNIYGNYIYGYLNAMNELYQNSLNNPNINLN